jgi:hypothetical protein
MIEQWKWVVGYEGLYRVSNLGRIMRVKRAGRKAKLLRMKARDTGGRLGVGLRKDGIVRTEYVDRIVLAAWVGEGGEGQTVLHGGMGIANNSITNLTWGPRTCKRCKKGAE